MKSKKRQLEKSLVYTVLNPGHSPNEIKKLISLGVGIIQLRDKNKNRQEVLKEAVRIKKHLTSKKVLFIINDYLEIARISDVDGLHLGQNDMPIEAARKILGRDKIIGISCHSLKQAKDAQKRGADYIGIGPVFKTPTKPNTKPIGLGIIKEIAQIIKIPFFAIGGINKTNVAELARNGARKVAVVRAAFQAAEISRIIRAVPKHYN